MADHIYTLKTISPKDLEESPVLRATHFLEQFAALPFRASALDELPEPAILDYLHRHPAVVEERKKKKKKNEEKKGKRNGEKNRVRFILHRNGQSAIRGFDLLFEF